MPGIYLQLTDEQQLLREAAAGTLARTPTLERARAALDGEPPLDLWPTAVEAGWPGLLSAEAVGGAGLGAYEAMLVLEECGRVVADAGLLGHLPAAALLEAAADQEALRGTLTDGPVRAALVVVGEPLVLDAARSDILVVINEDHARTVSTASAHLEPRTGYDATRSLAAVTVPDESDRRLDVDPAAVRDAVALQRALLAADSVGAASGALEMATAYAIDRHAFGRAIGSYQAIKHKLTEMLRRTENARSLLVLAGQAWTRDRPAFALYANAARVAAAEALDLCAPENIFIHGGIGATWEHDAQLYYRRAELSRRLCGGADAAAETVAELLIARQP